MMARRGRAEVLLAVAVCACLVASCFNGDTDAAPPDDDPEPRLGADALTQIEIDPSTGLDSIVDLGIALYRRAAYDSARTVLEEASALARAAGDTAVWARAITWRGLRAEKVGDYEEAGRLGLQALDLKQRAGLQELLARSYNALGLLAWQEGRLEDALELYQQSRDAALRMGQTRELEAPETRALAVVAGNQGLVYFEFGEFDRARRGFTQMLEVGRSLGDDILEANALSNLGMLEARTGDPAAAVPLLEDALALARSLGLVANEYHYVGQLGTAYAAMGDLGQALDVYDAALAGARERGLRQEEASNLEIMADLYREAGDYARALRLYDQAKEINEDVGLTIELGTDLRREAEIYALRGNLTSAAQGAEEALDIHVETGARIEEMYDLIALAEIAALQGEPEKADQYLNRASAIARGLGARAPRIDVALAEARVADAAAAPIRVLEVLDSAESLIEGGGYAAEWQAAGLKAKALLSLGRVEEAATAGRHAVSTIEQVRSTLGSGILQNSYAAARRELYALVVTILSRTGEVEEAFAVADAARGTALRSSGAARWAYEEETFGAEREEMLLRIDRLVESYHHPDNWVPEAELDLRRRLEDARTDYEAFLVRAAQAPSNEVASEDGGALASEVMSALGPREALLEYLVTPDRVVIFVVRSDGVRTLERLITAENLASRVRMARELIGRPETGDRNPPPILERLHEVLVEPVLRAGLLGDADRLYLVPHGVLSYLPFSALRDPVTGTYLAEQFTLVRLPSAEALPALRLREGANGAVGRSRERAHIFAPYPEGLPASELEARAVERSLRRSRVWLGEEATESRVRDALETGGVVHLATHGVMNARNPMFSRVALAPGQAGGSEDDGRLEVHELLAIRIGARLVFLSGCETGLGVAGSTRFDEGDDYATLAEAFLYAGASNVIATLWRVEDESAGLMADMFYRELQTHPPAEALARSRREMMRSDRFHEPYYWAAYVLSGSGL